MNYIEENRCNSKHQAMKHNKVTRYGMKVVVSQFLLPDSDVKKKNIYIYIIIIINNILISASSLKRGTRPPLRALPKLI